MERKSTRRWWALAALTLGVLAVGLDVTVLSVALPTLAVSLHASESDLQWFSSGYALVLAAAMLPAGVLGDRFGRKRVLIGALVVFGTGSIARAYATNPGQFIAGRLLLGAAGAAIVVMALSVMAVLFSEEERPRAVGVWAASAALKNVPSERSGTASALIQAMQKVGAPLGSAIFGSVLVTVYQSQLALGGLPPAAAAVVRQSVFAGVAVAQRIHSPALLGSVRESFVSGMDAALFASAGIAALAMVVAVVFMPGRAR